MGITFDYKFSLIPHTNELLKNCSKALNTVKFLCDTWWGSVPDTILTLYKSYIRYIIDYDSFIYSPRLKHFEEKLEKIQFAAVRAALGYRITTATNGMLGKSKLLLIKERAKLLCKCFIRKSIC